MAGQVWATSSLGGYMYSLELSDTLRTAVQPLVKFRQFQDAKDFTSKGLHRGQTVTWDEFSDVADTSFNTLAETSTIPEDSFTITQGTGTVSERGRSVPYTGFLDNLSKFPVEEIVRKVLKNHCKKELDTQAYNQYNLTPLRVVAATATATDAVTLTTNGTATTTNSVAFGKNHVKAIVDIMKERNIPPYMADDYIGIAHPTTWRQMKNDLEAVHQYTTEGFGMILNGEIGRYEGVRFIEQTNIAKTGFSAAKSNFAFFFGEDTVAEMICVPEEVRGKIPSDYGRSRGVAWYYLGGSALIHTTAAQARIVKWDSAS
jgi:N4-gp56 family major capsid protein